MKSLLLLSLLLAAVPTHARAECPTITSAAIGATCVRDVMVLGAPGTWFDVPNTQKIVRANLLNDQLVIQVDEYSKLMLLWKRENKALRDSVNLLQDTQANLQAQLLLANKDAREARATLATYPRWYASPIFWGITMFIAGAAIQNVCCSGK